MYGILKESRHLADKSNYVDYEMYYYTYKTTQDAADEINKEITRYIIKRTKHGILCEYREIDNSFEVKSYEKEPCSFTYKIVKISEVK